MSFMGRHVPRGREALAMHLWRVRFPSGPPYCRRIVRDKVEFIPPSAWLDSTCGDHLLQGREEVYLVRLITWKSVVQIHPLRPAIR